MSIELPKPVQQALFPVVTLAAYLVGVVPAEGGFGDVSTNQWLAAIVFLGAAYGIGSMRDPSVVATLDRKTGDVLAGPASAVPTGAVVADEATVSYLRNPIVRP